MSVSAETGRGRGRGRERFVSSSATVSFLFAAFTSNGSRASINHIKVIIQKFEKGDGFG